jgi:membrane protease YdiL (CAAX protease family)
MMKGLSIPGSIPYFAIPSAAMAAAIYGSVPLLDRAGVPLAINVIAHFVLILGGLGVLALVLGARDDQQKLSRRMWLTAPHWTDIVLGILIGSFGLWLYNQLQVTDAWISNATSIKPPAWLDHLFANGKFLDLPMRGNWWLLVLFLVFYLCNVVGEELWWRSYILPRQVLGIGRFAWLANGTLWVCFHLFFAWDMLALLPIALLIALAVQWRRSAWIGIVAHGCLNSVTWPLLWAGITHG